MSFSTLFVVDCHIGHRTRIIRNADSRLGLKSEKSANEPHRIFLREEATMSQQGVPAVTSSSIEALWTERHRQWEALCTCSCCRSSKDCSCGAADQILACRLCKSALTLRTSRAGELFWGCDNFSDSLCKYTERIVVAAAAAPVVSATTTTGVSRRAAVDTVVRQENNNTSCLLYTSPSPRDLSTSRMPSSA